MAEYVIAVCDDCREDRQRLMTMILNHPSCPENVLFEEYSSGESLLDNYHRYAAIVMDIELEGMDGLETANLIREMDKGVPLLFWTGHEEPSPFTFRIRPLSYMVKGCAKRDIFIDLKILLEEMVASATVPTLTVTSVGKMYVVEPDDILYIEIHNKTCRVVLAQSGLRKLGYEDITPCDVFLYTKMKLSEIYDELKDYGFVYAHKSYIVNIANVVGRRENTVILKGEIILNVSRSQKQEFDLELSRYRGVRFMRRGRKIDG